MKELLQKQIVEAFDADDEMLLLCSLDALEQTEAEWKLNPVTWSIEEILYHVGSCKIEYCKQGFAKWTGDYPRPFGDVSAMADLARTSHEHFLQCLDSCTEDDLRRSMPTRHHGESAAHFFWIMIMHDISHGAQIRAIRRAYGSRTDYYPVR